MKFSYLGLHVLLGCIVIFLGSSSARASWSLNTPERQWNALWAGESLVWNDNRLGNVDIFIRTKDGLVKPLVAGSLVEELIAASTDMVLYRANGEVLSLKLQTKEVELVTNSPQFSAASVLGKSVAWREGAVLNWRTAGVTKTRAVLGITPVLTDFGVAWVENDRVVVWTTGADVVIPCSNCQEIGEVKNHLALFSAGTISFWPNDLQPLQTDHTGFSSNGRALLYWKNNLPVLWSEGSNYRVERLLSPSTRLGLLGFVSEQYDDINLSVDPVPTFVVLQRSREPNSSSFSGTATGAKVALKAISGKNTITQEVAVEDGLWSIPSLIPASAAEGEYAVSGHAISLLGLQGQEIGLGSVVVDHTAPKVTSTTATTDLDSVRLNWITNEKTSGTITLTTSDDEPITRSLTRLTLSHTTTISDLDPGTSYQCRIVAFDQVLNQVSTTITFMTLPLSSAPLSAYTTLVPKAEGVWEGRLLAEPGVIAAKSAIVLFDRPMFVTWTVGRPPPNLTRGSPVRLKGTMNTKGTALLLHNSKTAVVVEQGSEEVPVTVHSGAELAPMLYHWVSLSGPLTSVTKTGWKIDLGDQIITLYWASTPPSGFAKGDVAQVLGFYYLDDDDAKVAAFSAEVISKAPTSESASSESTVQLASARFTTLPIVTTSIITPEIEMTESRLISRDKIRENWYTLVLFIIGAVINRLFFFTKNS